MHEPTTLLFHDEPYETSARAWLDAIDRDDKGNLFVVLSQTLFYPQGGGQKGDRGSLLLPDGSAVPIVDTRKDGDVVRHYVEAEEPAIEPATGEEVSLALDWAHRYQQMRIHSAAHLIHCFLEQVKSSELPPPVQSPLSSDGADNQYDYADRFEAEDLAKATMLLNEFISGGEHAITTEPDEQRGAGFRWWRCEDWAIPCGGVHPRDAAEVGAVTTELRVKKGKARVQVALVS